MSNPFYVEGHSDLELSSNLGTYNLTSRKLEEDELFVSQKTYLIHGITLYVCWFGIGFLLLATKRYWKTKYYSMHFLHMFLGWVVMLVTVIMSLLMIRSTGWIICKNAGHNALGVVLLILVVVVWGSGMATGITGKFYKGDKLWTDNDLARRIG